MERPDWAPVDVDLSRPSAARMYDALLGGSHNFELDRQAAARAKALVPDLPLVAYENRAFMRRAVRQLAAAGVDQFIDIGAGIPAASPVHEVVRDINPSARVVYVDNDPVAVAHGDAILSNDPLTIAIGGDLRRPERIMSDPALRRLIDLDRPVAVLLVAVLHLLTDDDRPADVVAALRSAVAPGSFFVISHLTSEQRPDAAAQLGALSNRTGVPIAFRSGAEISQFFTGLDVVEPGIVPLPAWQPESPAEASSAERSLGLAGVGRRG